MHGNIEIDPIPFISMVEEVAGNHFYSLHHLGGANTIREWGELAEDDP